MKTSLNNKIMIVSSLILLLGLCTLHAQYRPLSPELFVTTAEASQLDFSISALPRNEFQQVYLSIPYAQCKKMSFSIAKENGQLIEAGDIEGPFTQLKMDRLTPGTYFLTTTLWGQPVKTFKIIKSN